MKADIRDKRIKITGDVKELVEADPVNVTPFASFFSEHFIWSAGEYELTVMVDTNIESANIEKRYRFTLFEYYEEELKKITEEYKYGFGILFESTNPQSVVLDVKEA